MININELDRADLYSYFREKVKQVGVSNFFNVYDYNEFHNYFKKNRSSEEYKMFVSLTEVDFNEFITSIQNKKEILTNFIKNNSLYYSIFGYCNTNSLRIILNEIKNNEDLSGCNYSFLSSIPYDTVNEYINEYATDDEIALIVNYNHSIKAPFFKENTNALKLINDDKISLYHAINGNLKVSKDILYSDKLFETLKHSNIIEFRNNFNSIMKNNPSIFLEEKLNNYEDCLILNFDLEADLLEPYKNLSKDEYYSKLDNKNKDKFLYSYEAIHMNCKSYDEMLKKLSNKKLSDLIIDRLFKDNYYNVLINIREMFNYNEKLQNSLIEKEYLDIYMLLLNFDSLTNKEKIEFFKKNKDKDLGTKFYEDLRKCKNDAYNSIINSLYVPNNKNELLSNKYGVDIYLLDGENFDMMIRGLKTPYCENTRLYRKCFSLINNDNTSRVNSNYYYGYNNIDYDYIIHVSEGDSFSADMLENGTKKINRIMTSDEINSYCGISEIQIKTNQKNLEPSYLVAFNDINESYVENSKKLGIPIILINEEKYNKRKLKNNNIFSNKNEYIYDSFDEQRYRK